MAKIDPAQARANYFRRKEDEAKAKKREADIIAHKAAELKRIQAAFSEAQERARVRAELDQMFEEHEQLKGYVRQAV